MRNQRGFIQIPLLIAIFIGIVILGGVGYLGVQQYKNNQAEEIEKSKQLQAQQNALEDAKAEIEKLKTASEVTQKKQDTLEKTIKDEAEKPYNTLSNASISASEINSYLSGIVEITCKDSSGAGSLWNIDSDRVVVTNAHVIENPNYSTLHKQFYCTVTVTNPNGDFESMYSIFPLSKWSWNSETDVAVMSLVEKFYPTGQVLLDWMQKPMSQMNYKISTLKKCPAAVEIGSPVVIIGYPASGDQEILGGAGIGSTRIVTNGVISGYDKTVTPPLGPLPYQNYFVSAKIDSGNSGGIALAKTETGLCVLGIPTWLNVGNYDTQGLIQNFQNVMHKN